MKLNRIAALVLTLLAAGCSTPDEGGDAQRVCAPGASQACACNDGRAGAQVCDEAGARFDACECAAAVEGEVEHGGGEGGEGAGGGDGADQPDPEDPELDALVQAVLSDEELIAALVEALTADEEFLAATQGPAGPQGAPGAQGLPGAPGGGTTEEVVRQLADSEAFATAVSDELATNEDFLAATEGPEGPAGPAGERGPPGPPGDGGEGGAGGPRVLDANGVDLGLLVGVDALHAYAWNADEEAYLGLRIDAPGVIAYYLRANCAGPAFIRQSPGDQLLFALHDGIYRTEGAYEPTNAVSSRRPGSDECEGGMQGQRMVAVERIEGLPAVVGPITISP